jgi:hypothetical protein
MLGAGASISLGRLSRPVRYAAAVAAGLVLGIAGAQFTAVRSTGLNIEELVGTMAGKQGVLPNRVDRAVLDLSGLSGSVNLYELGSTLVVEFDLASQQPIDVAVACDGRTARIDGLGSRDQPGGHYAIALASPRSPGAAVDLQFFSGGVLIHRESLRTGGAEIIGPG